MNTLSSDEIRAAQMLTAATMAAWLAAGIVPGLNRHARLIRIVVLAVYLAGAAGFTVWVLLR